MNKMKYQGVTDVCFEINDVLGLRVSFELQETNGTYTFKPHHKCFYNVDGDVSLSAYDHYTQKLAIIKGNDLMDEYIAANDHEMLIALASDKLLNRLDKEAAQERAGY